MGSTHSAPAPTPAPPHSLASYFIRAPTPRLVHDHPHSVGDAATIQSILMRRGLPADLAQRVCDYAHVWGACRRVNRLPLDVDVMRPRPGGRGQQWRTGQEEELGEVEGIDREGDVWYLVSAPVGCTGDGAEGEGEGEETGGRGTGEGGGGGDDMDGEDEFWDADEDVYPGADPELSQIHFPGTRPRRRSARASSHMADSNDGNDSNVDLNDTASDEPRRRWWVRAVAVETNSRDQGWADHMEFYGTYEGSYSWFELGLLRDGKEVEGSRCHLQNNVVAGQYYKPHVNVLRDDHPLLRAARDGDRIVLWVRAQYPGWVNRVKHASMTVYTSPYPPH